MPQRASIIIPNWNGYVHLEVCLSSLQRQTMSSFEVILVDNASTDESVAYVRRQFPEVHVVVLDRNRGFTGACNAGYEIAQGEFVILLNNDTEVDSGWLEAIIAGFDAHPQVGSIASKIMLYDRRDHFHTAGDYYRIDGIPGNRGVWQQDVGQYDEEEYVFSACGAAAAYRRTMLEQIGFLDERFYFSCEDVDLGWRAHLAGWHVLYVPEAIVYHKLKATGGGITASYFDGRNYLYLIWKNYPGELLRLHWPRILSAQWEICKAALRAWRGAAARARLRGQLAGLFGIFVFWPKRGQTAAGQRLSDDSLIKLLTPVDETL